LILENKKQDMINLILDTNAWIYLANGYNSETKKYEEESHFETANWLLNKIKNKECRVFSNYIVKLEWVRNVEKIRYLIERYEGKVKQKKNELKNQRKAKNYLELAEKYRDFEKSTKEKISKNELHIKTVQEILDNSIEIPVLEKHKLEAVDLAIQKKPPFHHKDNSVADAIIFLSAVDYFSYNESLYLKDTFFISNNTSDFGKSTKNKDLHPELAERLRHKPIIFKTNLAKALKLGNDVIEKYQNHIDRLYPEPVECVMGCKGRKYFMNNVYFEKYKNFEVSKGYNFNPHQLVMNFNPEKENEIKAEELKAIELNRFFTINIGCCEFCYATHIKCGCGEIYASYGDNLGCICGRKYSLHNDYVQFVNQEKF